MLGARPRQKLAAALAVLLVAALAVAPTATAKTKKVGGSVTITVPGVDPNTGVSNATGFVHAKRGCQRTRVLRFAFFNADGTPLVNGPQAAVVSGPSGSFLAALLAPSAGPNSYLVKVFVDPVTKRHKGKKVKCRPIVGPDSLVAVT